MSSPATDFLVVAVPPTWADDLRRTRRDAFGAGVLTPRSVTEPRSAPCRVCLRDAEPGDEVLLAGYSPFAAAHAYRTVGPIFVHARPCAPHVAASAVPEAVRRRLLSVRAHDESGELLEAEVTPGDELAALARRFLADPRVHELHVHHARPGCFACKIVRA